MSKKKENGNADPVPDSTTKPNFYTDDEVLMQRKDGNFYLGTLIRIDWAKEQALVKFGDDTESWSSFGQLTKLSAGVECVKCKESTVEPSNDILVCDSCSQGYHQMCHSPPITTAELKVGVKWECFSCQEESRKLVVSQRSMSVSPSLSSSPEQIEVPKPEIPANVATECQRKKLPYNINDLHWDMQHRVNTENKYCYCARSGKWFLQMLQCGRCRQWFHARCIISLRMPLLFGDRFFVFVCSICNAGKEFLRRLEVKWLDLVHLAIFNLTLAKAVKYQDVDDDIVNFINEHWDQLQLPPKMRDTSLSDRRDHVLSMLNANRNRFRYSREMKKRTTMWGLKHRVPPPTPVFSLPPNKPLSDQVLLDAWHNNARLQFLPCLPSGELPSKKYDLYPDWEKNQSNLPGLDLLHVGSRPLILPKGVPATGHNVCIKSSSPCYPESRAQIERRIKAQTLENDTIFRSRKSRKHDEKSPRESQELPPTPPSSESNMEAPANLQDTSGDESSSRGTLDSFIPPPMDFEGRNNPFMTSIPLSLTPIVRPAKRRLSEKDIRITSNGEIKRRRVRRGSKLPSRVGQVTDGLRRMKRPRSGPSTPTGSPVKNGHPPSLKPEDLQSTVSTYFGAMNRIASGEKFTIRARRILPSGKTQYLIDWGCSPT